jgi:hypothetical protein
MADAFFGIASDIGNRFEVRLQMSKPDYFDVAMGLWHGPQ